MTKGPEESTEVGGEDGFVLKRLIYRGDELRGLVFKATVLNRYG
jgi:hypothetical protein